MQSKSKSPPSFAQNAKEGWGTRNGHPECREWIPVLGWGWEILGILLDWGWVMRQG